MRLSTQLVLAAAGITILVSVITSAVWVRQLENVVVEEARGQAASLAIALASSHYADVTQGNDAQIQLEFEAIVKRAPDDVVYLIASSDRAAGRVIAAVPSDIIGAAIPDVVPLAVTQEAERGSDVVTRTFLIRDTVGQGTAGDPVFDATSIVRLRDGTRAGSLRVGIRYERTETLFRRAARNAIMVGAAALALGLVLARALARRVSAPVAALGARMARVAEGTLEPHETHGGPLEVRELAEAYNGMITGLRQKQALERYVPAGALDSIYARASEGGIVEPRREHAVILFADLRGFSTLSEKSTPAEVLALLNEYSDAMSEVVVAAGGDVNELLGDAVLAVFGGEDAAKRSVACASAMHARLAEIANGQLRMGIGLHLGEVVLGTIGTGDRLKFAVVGDAVNVAARIQERSKGAAATAILASGQVRGAAGEGLHWIDRGEMPVRGREGNILLWELANVEP